MAMAGNKKTSANSVIWSTVLVIFGLVVILGFSYKNFWLSSVRQNPKLVNLEKSLQDIRAAMNVDSVRQFNIQKIMAIMNRYNDSIPSGRRYEIANEIFEMSVKYTNLDVNLICAVITHESGGTWDPEVRSDTGALGLFQLMPTPALWIAHYEGITWNSPEEVLFNPIYNIRIGCRRLSTLIATYELEGGLAAFNGGEKKAAKWLANNKAGGILWAETDNYIPQVLELYHTYKEITL